MITVSRKYKTDAPSAADFESQLNAIMEKLVDMQDANILLLDSAIAANLDERTVTMTLTVDVDDLDQGEQVADSCIVLAIREVGGQTTNTTTRSRSAELVYA